MLTRPVDTLSRLLKALKHLPVESLSCICTKDIDELFCRLGAGPKALAVSEPIVPDPIVSDSMSDGEIFVHFCFGL